MPRAYDTRSLPVEIKNSFYNHEQPLSDHQVRRLMRERGAQDAVAPDPLDILIDREEARSQIKNNIPQEKDEKSKTVAKPYSRPPQIDFTIRTHKKDRKTGDKIPITRGRIPIHHYNNEE